MKKFLVCFLMLFFAVFVNAAVNVEIGGKTKKYPDGSILKIAAKKRTTVKYSNFNIVVPRGNNFILDCENDQVTFKGKLDKPINMNSYVIETDSENADFAITSEGEVIVNEGSITIRDAQNNVAVASSGSDTVTKLDMPSEKFVAEDDSEGRVFVTEAADEVNSEVNETGYVQKIQDTDLSPSAPTR